MPAATTARAAAWLRHTVLLTALLAVIAGFLGMHVLSGSHGMHSQSPLSGTAGPAAEHAAAPAPAPAHNTHSSHDQPGAPAPADSPAPPPSLDVIPASVTVGGTEVPPSCVCQGGCTEKQAVHAGCTPSPAGASLSAPQPGSTFLDGGSWTAAQADRPAGYAYVPGTPTPRDLSISRT